MADNKESSLPKHGAAAAPAKAQETLAPKEGDGSAQIAEQQHADREKEVTPQVQSQRRADPDTKKGLRPNSEVDPLNQLPTDSDDDAKKSATLKVGEESYDLRNFDEIRHFNNGKQQEVWLVAGNQLKEQLPVYTPQEGDALMNEAENYWRRYGRGGAK